MLQGMLVVMLTHLLLVLCVQNMMKHMDGAERAMSTDPHQSSFIHV